MTNHDTTNFAAKARTALKDRNERGLDIRLPTKIKRCKRTGKIISTGTLRCGLNMRQVAAILGVKE